MKERRRSTGPSRRRWSDIEREVRRARGPLIAGVDEVGRGPLAGPVVACAVIMPPDARAIRGVDDSKVLSALQRTRLAALIRQRALAIGIGAASVREIDRLNIYHASTLAMRRALGRLALAPNHVLIDGKAIRSLTVEHTAVVHGDARCFSIACASIIAKVTRDRLMRQLAARYPGYRWEQNVGYATADHVAGLAATGLTPHHRRSFMRARQLTLDLDATPASGEYAVYEADAGDVLSALTAVTLDAAPRSDVVVLPELDAEVHFGVGPADDIGIERTISLDLAPREESGFASPRADLGLPNDDHTTGSASV